MTATRRSTAAATPDYVFSNQAAVAARQAAALEAYLDPITTGILEEIDLQPGAACLELGSGGGSIACWLTDQTGPTGTVVAVDLDPAPLPPEPNLHVVAHDLRLGLPVSGPFDLIHTRLVLEHLPNREQLLRQLTEVLAPGGWLVVGEFSGRTPIVYTAASDHDARLFTKVVDAFRHLLVARHGVDSRWAYRLHGAMAGAGLEQVRTMEHSQSWTGGEAGSQLHVTSISQLRDRLLAAGLTQAELDSFHELMSDPRFACRSWHFVCTCGRKPSAA